MNQPDDLCEAENTSPKSSELVFIMRDFNKPAYIFGVILIISDTVFAGRPNILFLFADDWGRQASIFQQVEGESGISSIVSTPHIDRIAHEGVLFRHAFVNAPSCTPCRSSLFAGQHFWRTGRGAILLGAMWDPDLPSWPLLLEENGYVIGKSFKVWSPGIPRDAPFGMQEHAYEEKGQRFNQFSQSVTKLVAAGKPLTDAKQEILEEVRANFRTFLAICKQDQPFCYWFGPTNVHRKWAKGSGRSLWDIDPDQLLGKMPPFLPDVPVVREDLADYLGEVQAFDSAVGILLEELKHAGKYRDTLIVVSGDHGPPGFPHGKCNLYDFGTRITLAIAGPGVLGERIVDDFVCLPDLAPTLLEAGEVPIPSSMTARSLWPVLQSDREGLVDATRDAVFIGRERHVANARTGNLPYPQRAIRTAEHLFVINYRPDRYPLGDPKGLEGDHSFPLEAVEDDTFITLADEDAGPTKAWLVVHRNDPEWQSYFYHAYAKRPREELYNLAHDPDQMHNVVTQPENALVVKSLRQRLIGELQRTGDPRLIDEGRFFETLPMAGSSTERSHTQPDSGS